MPRSVRVLYVIDVTLGLAYFLVVMFPNLSYKLWHFFHLELEQNLPTWYSSTKLFVLAVLVGLFALSRYDRRQPTTLALFALPCMFLALSLDEIAELHEWLGYRLDVLFPEGDRAATAFEYTGIWGFVIGIPFLLISLGLLLALRRHLRISAAALPKLMVGMVLLIVGACGVETFANFIDRESPYFFLQVLGEEVLEMLGVTTMIWGSIDLLRAQGFKLTWLGMPGEEASERSLS